MAGDRSNLHLGPVVAATLLWLLPVGVVLARVQGGPANPVQFHDVTDRSGLDFHHVNGRTGEKHLPETMGGGVLVFDFDRDEWPDVLFVNSGSIADGSFALHGLFRNAGDGTFTDATQSSGIRGSGYGMGACAADFDNDGWIDLYVTNVGPNSLYHNEAGRRFVDVTDVAGVASDGWSSSCAFGDIDQDGDVDLYVANYLAVPPGDSRYCGLPDQNVRIYCDPGVYDGVPDLLYRNDGDGTFTDVSRLAGIDRSDGKGLGVVFTDYDQDGAIDIYVANDLVPNFLFHNQGDGTFREIGLLAGVAVGGDGRPMSGMGTDAADINGDGLPDIIVTNMDRETHNLYLNLGSGLFAETTFESGVGAATLPYVGWGTAFFDYDNDTDLDLAIVNGAVLDNVAYFRDSTYPQLNLLLRNDGSGHFEDLGEDAGPGFAIRKVSRGLAVADFDTDGDLDLLVGNNGQIPDFLRNEGGNALSSIEVRVVGTRSNRDGIGSRLVLTLGDQTLVREVKAGSGYLGQNDMRVHFGLGRHTMADRLEIRWPSGQVDTLTDVAANQILVVQEGGVVLRRIPY